MDDKISFTSSKSSDINDGKSHTGVNIDITSSDVPIYKDAEESDESTFSKSVESPGNSAEGAVKDDTFPILTQLQSELVKLDQLQESFQKLYLRVLFKGANTNRLKPDHVALYRLLSELSDRKNERNGLQRLYSPMRSNNHYYQMIRNLSQLYRFSEFLKLLFMLFLLNVPIEVLYFAIVSYCGYCATLSLSLHRFMAMVLKLLSVKLRIIASIVKKFVSRFLAMIRRSYFNYYNGLREGATANATSTPAPCSTTAETSDDGVDSTNFFPRNFFPRHFFPTNIDNTDVTSNDNADATNNDPKNADANGVDPTNIDNTDVTSNDNADTNIVDLTSSDPTNSAATVDQADASGSRAVVNNGGLPIVGNFIQFRDLIRFDIRENSGVRNRFQQGNSEGNNGQNQPIRQIRDRNYIEKFCYQLFFSFFMSLIPWWTPNPEYL